MISTERLFAMPAFEGLREIRRRLGETPTLTINEIIKELKITEADAQSLDLEASCILHEIVETCGLDGHSFYRECIRGVVLNRFPIWVKTIKLGRQVFAAKLEKDDHTIFENAGLLASPPSADVVEWWDNISHEVKIETDLEKMAQARRAEKMSWDLEKKRLLNLGIETDPIWIGLDDNTAGYDILSYERGEIANKNVLIEVKSTIASPARFFVTRNEWEQAIRSREFYFFHIWQMQKIPLEPIILKVSHLEPHIPSDNKNGKWQNAEILIKNISTT